ncbi:hypothetical protein SLAVM298S_03035 [Streptomyces lavendulae subsp. lavendulae]
MVETVVAAGRPHRRHQRHRGRDQQRRPRGAARGARQHARQPPLPGHREQQPPGRGLPGQRREGRPDGLARRHQVVQPPPDRGLDGVVEGLPLPGRVGGQLRRGHRGEQRRQVGLGQEQHPGQRQAEQHRPCHPGRAPGHLLREGDDGVETQVGQDRDRYRAQHGGRREAQRAVAGQRRQPAAPGPVAHQHGHRRDEEDEQDQDLHGEHREAHACGGPYAPQVQQGGDHHRQRRPHPAGDLRDQRVHRDPGEEVGDRRDQQVVQHRHPAGDQPRPLAQGLAGVGEHRARLRGHPHHLRVREGREGHRGRRDEVDERDGAVRPGVQGAEDPHGGHGGDEEEAVDDQVPESEAPAQGGGRDGGGIRGGRHRSSEGSPVWTFDQVCAERGTSGLLETPVRWSV